jgi:hypothetical protein
VHDPRTVGAAESEHPVIGGGGVGHLFRVAGSRS